MLVELFRHPALGSGIWLLQLFMGIPPGDSQAAGDRHQIEVENEDLSRARQGEEEGYPAHCAQSDAPGWTAGRYSVASMAGP